MFKDLLKQVMDEQQMNAATLSAVTGVSRSGISQYLSGKYEPSEKTKTKIAEALGLPADYFKIAEIKEDAETVRNVTVEQAAKILGQGKQTVRQALQDGVAPYGYAVRMPSGKYSYYISPYKLKQLTGVDVNKGVI